MNDLELPHIIIGQLKIAQSRELPDPHLSIRPFITLEAVLSSKIEGTQATIGEMLAASAGIIVKRDPEDLQEVQNYIVNRTENVASTNFIFECLF